MPGNNLRGGGTGAVPLPFQDDEARVTAPTLLLSGTQGAGWGGSVRPGGAIPPGQAWPREGIIQTFVERLLAGCMAGELEAAQDLTGLPPDHRAD
jgi:hypothetical protein